MDRLPGLPGTFPDLRADEGAAPQTMPEPVVAHPLVECAACFEECSRDEVVSVAEDHLCEDCFTTGYVSQFHEALKDESKFPVKYGSTVLELRHYRKFFNKEFIAEWIKKRDKYRIPVKRRLYCQNNLERATGNLDQNETTTTENTHCGTFLGKKRKDHPYRVEYVHCKTCNGLACTWCSGVYELGERHRCQEEQDDAFKGLQRGVDYQICPNKSCQVKTALQDGCNGVQCPFCRQDYCFICGQKSNPGHWNVGSKCPRFGKKDSDRAIFDQPVVNQERDGTEDRVAAIRELVARMDTEDRANAERLQTAGDILRLTGADIGRFQLELLQEVDNEALTELHRRILAIHPRNERIHDLIHELISGLAAYTAHVDTVIRFQTIPARIQEHNRILGLVDEIGGDLADWPDLRRIFDTYILIWDGRIAELRQLREL